MKTSMMAVMAAGLLIGCAAPLEANGGPEAGQGQAQTLSNREIVTRFIDLFYRQGRVREAFETYVAEDYIQHNPLAPDGRAAAIAALEPFFASQPNAIREVHRIIVDGNLAAVHVRVRQNAEDRGYRGRRPAPARERQDRRALGRHPGRSRAFGQSAPDVLGFAGTSRVRRADVLGPEAEADEARRNALEEREALHQPHQKRRLRDRDVAQDDAVDQPVLGRALHRLDDPGRQHPPSLDPVQQAVDDRVPAAIGPARMLAAATASWIARLMPTPPIGDMAWAASPIASRPGPMPAGQPVERDRQQFDLVPAREIDDRSGKEGRRPGDVRAEILEAPGAQRLGGSLREDIGALPVIAAIDQGEQPAGGDHPGGPVVGRARLRQAEPEDVHRRAEILERQQPPPRAAASAGRRRR